MIVVHTTFPSCKQAEKAARLLVQQRLAACASVYPCKSFFFWEGRLQEEREFVLELKTQEWRYPALERAILKIHPYSLPQVFAFKVHRSAPAYRNWVKSCTGQRPAGSSAGRRNSR
ncbi:MAG: divalent-cation tolerance protein CutA [Candidatus Micrarchaeota archaeon]|nr:divalent-cation tolerance protein CutA [Candidatus Micrarchaeota archaeon]